jgi:hypothetical protein
LQWSVTAELSNGGEVTAPAYQRLKRCL